VKERLLEAVEWPLKYPRLFEKAGVRPPKGILLSGPPGCGKTMLAKAIATESQVNFISVKGPALLSRYVGESEQAVRDVFHKARQAAPCIVFFDEMDALVPVRRAGGTDSHVAERVLSQFLAEMDGVEELRRSGAGGDEPERLLDPAMLRPDDLTSWWTSPPEAGTPHFLSVHLRGKPTSPKIDAAGLAARTEGFSGADIAGVCQRAAMEAAEGVAAAEGGSPDEASLRIEPSDFDVVLAEVKSDDLRRGGLTRRFT
jgi:transitional endoplasmic reticulum ATPase